MITWDGKKGRHLRQWKNEKWSASGGIWTHNHISHSRHMLLPTELPKQPSWQGDRNVMTIITDIPCLVSVSLKSHYYKFVKCLYRAHLLSYYKM